MTPRGLPSCSVASISYTASPRPNSTRCIPSVSQLLRLKEGLYVAYVERAGRALLKSMREADSRGAPATQRLRAGILAFLTYAEEHRSGWSVLHREGLAQGGPLAAELSELRERVAYMLTTLFNDEAFAHAFAGAGEALASWWLAHPGQPRERVAQVLMDIAQSGLGPPDLSARP
jgi:AcrR family transcriptional regulator